MRRTIQLSFCTVLALLLMGMSAWAHHSFTAVFDIYQPVIMNATVTRIQWINPHSLFHLEMKDDSGKTVAWTIESWGPANLRKATLTRDKISPGMAVKVRAYRAKDGSNYAYLRDFWFPDGSHVEVWVGGASGRPEDQR